MQGIEKCLSLGFERMDTSFFLKFQSRLGLEKILYGLGLGLISVSDHNISFTFMCGRINNTIQCLDRLQAAEYYLQLVPNRYVKWK